MEYFKATNDNKSFTLSHCWRMLKDCPKWQLSYGTYLKACEEAKQRSRANAAPGTIDLDDEFPGMAANGGRTPRPKGHKASKEELIREATTFKLQEKFKKMIAGKETTIALREERRRKEKEAVVSTFVVLQKKAMEIEETNAKARMKEAEAKVMAEERSIMMTDPESIVNPSRRAWYEKMQKDINDRHAVADASSNAAADAPSDDADEAPADDAAAAPSTAAADAPSAAAADA